MFTNELGTEVRGKNETFSAYVLRKHPGPWQRGHVHYKCGVQVKWGHTNAWERVQKLSFPQ